MDDQHKHSFEAEIHQQNGNEDRRFWFTKDKISQYIDKVKTAKAKSSGKLPEEYKLLKRYDVISFGQSVERLVLTDSLNGDSGVKFFVALEDLFRVIRDAHIACGHGGEKRTGKELMKTCANVTRQQIKLFLSGCENCQQKKAKHITRKSVEKSLMPNRVRDLDSEHIADQRIDGRSSGQPEQMHVITGPFSQPELEEETEEQTTGVDCPDTDSDTNWYHIAPSGSCSTMSHSTRLELGDYVAFNTADQDGDTNGADQTDFTGIQVKFEVEDPDYESAVEPSSVTAGLLRSFPPHAVASSQSAAQWSGSSSAVRTQLRKLMEDKSVDSNTAAQNVQSVIEDLLKKNESLLAKNDAQGYKPHSRRGRIAGEVGRSKEVVFPGPGQSTTFSTGMSTQGRVSQANSRHSPQLEQTSAITMGQLMRPKSPTRKCIIPEKDKSHFNLALMESQVGCEDGEKIFRVREHELVCAISSQTKFLNSEGHLVSSVDISYYWCNFCSFSTTSKSQLMQHVMEHRFHCKHCRYQSFSRADVIHHSTHSHPNFQETAAITQYCTLLSDYLRIEHPKEAQLDHQRKRKGPPEGDDDDGQQPSTKVSRNGHGKTLTKDFDLYDVSVEDLNETPDEEGGGVMIHDGVSKNSTSTSSVTILSTQSEAVSRTQTPSLASNVLGQTISSLVSSPVPEVGHPIITQVFSASNIPAAMVPDTPTSSSLQTSASDSTSKTTAQTSQPNASTTFFSNSVGAGTMQQMRSNLYWSCGYCKFTSTSQSGIKDHSVRQHSGKPHRYVALIKTEERSTPPPQAKPDEETSTNSDQTSEIEASGESVSDTITITQNDTSAMTEAEDPPVIIKQEPVPAEESAVPIRVRFPTPRNQPKETTALKCYHCQYSSRNLGPLRNHILSRHKGKCLVGLGGATSKVFMCTRSDCIFRSSSGQTFVSHAQECTPWMDKEVTDISVEGHLVKCLQATMQVAEEKPSPASSPTADADDTGTDSSKEGGTTESTA